MPNPYASPADGGFEAVRLVPKGLMAVPLLGLATTIITMIVVLAVGHNTDFELMGWYLNWILPIGAIIVGAACGSGYGLGSWIRGVKITGKLLWLVVSLQVCAYFTAQYLEYLDTNPRWPNGARVSFVEYYDAVTRSFAFKDSQDKAKPPGAKQPQAGMGAWGYAFRGLELLGFALGGLIVPAILRAHPYCEDCQLYMRSKLLATIPAGRIHKELKKLPKQEREVQQLKSLEEGLAIAERLAELAKAGDAAGFSALVLSGGAEASHVKKLSGRVEVHIGRCPRCESGRCRLVLRAGPADEGKTVELAVIPLSSDFVRQSAAES